VAYKDPEMRNRASKVWREKNFQRDKENKRKYYEQHKEEARLRQVKNWPRIKKRNRKGYLINKDKRADQKLMQLYGITSAIYHRMFEQQRGRCAICDQTSPYKLCVDHNHNTGKVRAMLCKGCNAALGHIEKLEFVLRAQQYLKDHANA